MKNYHRPFIFKNGKMVKTIFLSQPTPSEYSLTQLKIKNMQSILYIYE